ncbi:MAG: superoxide dismutase family protein [Ruminococcus sp.]|nr:superoxide dismutase family protein [Ruminococcus sp.]
MKPCDASAVINGSAAYPDIHGLVRFYQTRNGVLIAAEIDGLPYSEKKCHQPVFAFHIHDGTQCEGDMHDPFSGAMSHYNPDDCEHPFHAGDLPPLFGNHGYAFMTFLSDRFSLSEVIGKTVIIHGNPDDFTTQPSGNAGEKLACGVVSKCRKCCL